MRSLFIKTVLAITLLAAASSAAVAACSGGYCWGAVGIGTNGAWANAYDYPSQNDAARAAQNKCGGNCNTIKTFYNSCGAIAKGDRGGWGWASSHSADDAQSSAIAYCVPNDSNCRVITWACTSR